VTVISVNLTFDPDQEDEPNGADGGGVLIVRARRNVNFFQGLFLGEMK